MFKIFGGKKEKGGEKKAAPKKKGDADLAAFGIDPSMFEDFNEEEFEVPKTKSSFNEKDVLKGMNFDKEDEDIDVEFTEDDMNDPALLAALKEIGVDTEGMDDLDLEPKSKPKTGSKTASKQKDDDFDEAQLEAMMNPKKGASGAKKPTKEIDDLDIEALAKSSKKEAPKQAEKPIAAKPQAVAQPAPVKQTEKPVAQPAPVKQAEKPVAQPTPTKQATPVAQPAPVKQAEKPIAAKPQPVAQPAPVKQAVAQPTPVKQAEKAVAQPTPTKQSAPAQQNLAPAQTKRAPSPSKPTTAQPQAKAVAAAPAKEGPKKSAVTESRQQVRAEKKDARLNAKQQSALLKTRMDQYRAAAITSKSHGNIEQAKEHLKMYKHCERVKQLTDAGKPVEMSQIPDEPSDSAPPAKVAAPAQQQPKSAPQAEQHPPAQKTAQPKAAPKAAVPQKAVKEDHEDNDPNPVDNMVSNDVLEWELQNITQQLASLKVKKQEPPEELVDRQQAVQLALTILQTKVASGQLDQDTYIAQLQAKVTEEKGNATKYHKEGKKEWALMALRRAKIMEKEIQATLEGGEE